MPPQESIRAPDSRIPHDGSTNVAAANPASEIEMSESVPIRPANEEDSRNETTAMDSYYRPYFRNETSDSPAPNTPTSYTLSPEILAKYNLQNEYPFMDFDDFLPILGEFGRYQKILFFTMIPFAFFVAFVYFTQIFITLVPDRHWCKVPQLRDMPLHERLELAIPKTENGDYEKCLVYDMDWLKVMETNGTPKADPSWRKIPCPSGWEYDTTDLPYTTISTELNWVCDKAALPHIAQAIFFCGAICGGLIFGWMADRYGRIPALISANLLGFVGGVMTASTLNFWQFALCRFVVGFAFDNCFTMMYIVVLEYVGPKWRTFVANMSIAIFFTTASCLLPWLSYFIASWRWICIATGFPLAIAILTPIVVPESARWLVSRGRLQEAVAIIRSFERINRADVKQKHYSQFIDSCIKLQKEEEAEKSYSVLDLFKTPRLRKITLLLIFIWMAISLVFDGHVRNVSTLGMNVFITFTIASATEFPADTFLTMVLDRWGRRWLACGSMVVSGIFSLLATTVPTGVPSASLAILGRFSVNISYNIGLQYAAELLPTVVRARGVALIHIMGYVASILSPFVVYLATINPSLPLLVLGTLGIIGGILALFLPETMDRDLPQTLADGENFGKDQKFFNVPCFQKKEEETPAPNRFKRDTCTNTSLTSIRASTRGELYRSSIINRSSRKSKSQSNDQSYDQSHREQVV